MDFPFSTSTRQPSSYIPLHRTQLHPRMHSLFWIFFIIFVIVSTYIKKYQPRSNLFAVVIHASLYSSKINVFEFLAEGKVPFLHGTRSSSMKVTPGLMGFKDDPGAAGRSIMKLVDFAKQKAPNKLWAATKVYLMATQELGKLSLEVRDNILGSCRNVLRSSGFLFQDEWARSIRALECVFIDWYMVHPEGNVLTPCGRELGNGYIAWLINKKISSKEQHALVHLQSLMKAPTQSFCMYIAAVRGVTNVPNLMGQVNDMMDAESIHMQYRTNSLQICFLSDEVQAVASIIKSILQCAVDLQYCLTTNTSWEEKCEKSSTEYFSRVKMSQVISIQQKFEKNLKDLHLCYLKGPKHGEFGLSRFWESLNYNEFYHNLNNGMEYLL